MFNMQSFYFGKAPTVKGDKFFEGQSPQNDIERDQRKPIPYSSIVAA